MSEIIIPVALKTESSGVFERIIKNYSNVHLLYTNVGKINAAYFLTQKIYELKQQNKKINFVLNIGTAGGIDIPRKSIVCCHEFIQRDFDHRLLGLQKGINYSYCENYDNPQVDEYCDLVLRHDLFVQNLPIVICGTGDNFENPNNCQSKDIKELSKSVEEMEAYSLALVCKYENIKFNAVKYVSDEINLNNNKPQNDQFENSLEECAEALGNVLNNILKLSIA